MNKSEYRSTDEVDPRVQVGVRHHEAITGERPPTNPNEARSRENSQTTEHPYDSFIEGADVSAVAYLEDTEPVQEKEVAADGGFEYERVFESADTASVDTEDYDVSVDEYAGGVAVRGTETEVEEFVSEFEQAFGAEAATDGGRQTMADVNHQQSQNYAEGAERVDGAQNTFH
jgi:hypothetical protein